MASKDGEEVLNGNALLTPNVEEERAALVRAAKTAQTSTTTAVTKKRNELATLLNKDEDNLHIVKSEMAALSERYSRYIGAHKNYLALLTADEDVDREVQRHGQKENDYLAFCNNVKEWIRQAEGTLSDQLDNRSSVHTKASRRSVVSNKSGGSLSSLASARARERAKLAVLEVERTMLKKKQALRNEEEQLKMEMEIAKAEARERIFALATQPAHKVGPDMSCPFQNEENLIQFPSGSPPKLKPPLLQSSYLQPKPTIDISTLNPEAPPFVESNPFLRSGNPFEALDERIIDPGSLRQTHNELVATSRQIAAAMLLPQPEVPKFGGDPLEYRPFVIAFRSRIGDRTFGAADNLYYLTQHVTGDAKALISGCLHMSVEEGLAEAWRLLNREYGDPYKVSIAYLNTLLRWREVRHDDPTGLKRLSSFINKCKNAMAHYADLSVLNHPPNMQSIVQKLPSYLQNKWCDYATKLRFKGQRQAQFNDLAQFIDHASEVANDPVYGKDALKRQHFGNRGSEQPNQRGTAGLSSFAAGMELQASSTRANVSCPVCSLAHDLESCTSFIQKNLGERRSVVREKRLCFACLQENHISKNCTSKRICAKCKKFHPTLLHNDHFQSTWQSNSSEGRANQQGSYPAPQVDRVGVHNVPVNACSDDLNANIVSHAILPVVIRQKGNVRPPIATYAFYDGGSSGSFITEELLEELGASGDDVTLRLRTMHGKTYCKSVAVSNLEVSDTEGNNTVLLSRAYARPEIPVSKRQIPRPEMVTSWPHLRHISASIPMFREDLNVGLLIGSDCPLALEPRCVIPSVDHGPFAALIRHGWTICGPLGVPNAGDEILSNRIAVRETEDLKETILHMFETDFIEKGRIVSPDERGLSCQDQKFMEIVEKKTIYTNGHYTVPLPLRRGQSVVLPNNREQAVTRANWQRKKMKRNAPYHVEYTAFIDKMLERGYAKKIPDSELTTASGKSWYLPHHGVYHPTKLKLRVVFDCSAKFNGTSLNEELLQGPNFTNGLTGVLTRFREYEVAFTADVEKMFFQVNVPEEEQNYLRFLWWPNGNIDGDLHEYRMTVHIFGAVSSPSVANYALRRAAAEHVDEDNREVTAAVLRNFYVDDCLKSVSDVPAAVHLVDGLVKTCKAGGFRLTKFTSNKREVINHIPRDERSDEITKMKFDDDSCLPIERTLGLYWHVQSDCFGFSINVKGRPFTRRGILATVSSIYDPLGFLAPVVLPMKRLLQEMCTQSKLGWDDDVPEEYRARWERWLTELPRLNDLAFGRSFKLSGIKPHSTAQLHVFSDASTIGYGSVAYLRFCNKDDEQVVSFLMGKARVAPMKPTTIPRLELTAAVTSVQLATALQSDLDCAVNVHYHTDSTTVLNYIRNENRRFPIFVANRVRTIRDFSTPSQWHYIESGRNPADDGSRGMDPAGYVSNQRWFTGPSLLKEPGDEWLTIEAPGAANADEHEALGVVCCIVEARADESTLTTNRFLERYSSWFRLKRATTILRRSFSYLQKRAIGSRESKGPTLGNPSLSSKITAQELQEAENAILKFTQRQHFADVIPTPAVDGTIGGSSRATVKAKRASPLYRLDPFVKDGLMRVGGRLSRSTLPENTKNPILLPKRSHVTTLIVRGIHENLAHAGRDHVLSSLRETYWVISANSAVRHVIHQCVTCRRLRGCLQEQKMANLPKQRVEMSPPFTHTGLDYFGPFTVKQGRADVKRYGVIFTCMASRAVHIETANTLDTGSCIHAIRRFIARRGQISNIYCDNGTNFVGAEGELRKALAELDQDALQRELLRHSIDWTFNPPSASHMGGSWERMIRTIRKVLNPMLREYGFRLDDEALRTLFCEVEAVVNSRPLTTVSGDASDLRPLTPNHLLTAKSHVTAPVPGRFQSPDAYARRRWRRVQFLSNLFWTRWKREYIVTLQQRQKWTAPTRNQRPGDVVIVKDDNVPRNSWPLGIVEEVEADENKVVRAVKLRTASSQLRRPVHKLVLLVPAST